MHRFFCCLRKSKIVAPELQVGLLTEEILPPQAEVLAAEPEPLAVLLPETTASAVADSTVSRPEYLTESTDISPMATNAVDLELAHDEDELSFLPSPPPNSPEPRPHVLTTNEQKCQKMLDYLISHTRSAITVLDFLQINNLIIAPLKSGNYELASANFCADLNQKPEVFQYICNKLGILTENVYSGPLQSFKI